MRREAAANKPVTAKRCDDFRIGLLPHAKGFQNGFLGEMDEAARAGFLNTAAHLCVPFLSPLLLQRINPDY